MNTASLSPATESVAGGQLRPSVLADSSALSPDAKREIQALSGARPARFFFELLLVWGVIGASIATGIYFHHWAVSLACILLISTRQMVLGILLHEQVHRLALRSKYADWFVNVFVVYPLFVTTVEDYAKVHLSHHKYCFTSKDPDFIRKSGDEWTFPKDLKKILVIVLRDITGLNVIRLIKGKTAKAGMTEFERKNPSPVWLRVGFFIVAAVLLTIFGGWQVFFLYWMLPLLTFTQLMVRWIAVIEHKYNMENASIHDTTPLLQLTWWQKILFPDLNFGMHCYHHMHPGVSFANLPRVHEIYRREGLVDESAIFRGQGSYMRYLLKRD
jgi:fatty acid desaturase